MLDRVEDAELGIGPWIHRQISLLARALVLAPSLEAEVHADAPDPFVDRAVGSVTGNRYGNAVGPRSAAGIGRWQDAVAGIAAASHGGVPEVEVQWREGEADRGVTQPRHAHHWAIGDAGLTGIGDRIDVG